MSTYRRVLLKLSGESLGGPAGKGIDENWLAAYAEEVAQAVKNGLQVAIVIGGGNTFALLKKMQEEDLLDMIFHRVKAGVPYIGWSAGSNVTCPTICTTNDMPIVQPESFKAIGAVKFQINPHYLDANPEGHAGETREQRIEEYIEANPRRWVVGLREGCMLHLHDGKMELIGPRPMRIFKKGVETFEVNAGDDLSFLL